MSLSNVCSKKTIILQQGGRSWQPIANMTTKILSLLFSRQIRRFCAQLEICKFNMQYIPYSALLAQETVYFTGKENRTKHIVTMSLC